MPIVPTILIVEDEPDLAELLRDYLSAANYSTYILNSGEHAVAWIKQNQPSIILLDLMLPGKSGLDICRETRQFSQTPIIMMTAKVEEIDRLIGLELGADDYVCKPYSPREIVARVKAVLRRTQAQSNTEQSLIQLDTQRNLVTIKDLNIDLTVIEFKLLQLLQQHPGHIFSREKIMSNIYNDYRVVSDRTIDSHIKKLRKKLQNAHPEYELIQSVYGLGYKWEAP